MSEQKLKTVKKGGPPRKHEPDQWMPVVCDFLAQGMSLYEACDAVGQGGPSVHVVLDWVRKFPETHGQRYARAREIGYLALGDKIDQIAAETHAYTVVPELDESGNQIYDEDGNPVSRRVLVPLSSDVIASKRLQVDTLKWKLSKMLPKVYGEKITNEHTGADGGPIAIAAVDLKNLSDEELENMNRLMLKATASGK